MTPDDLTPQPSAQPDPRRESDDALLADLTAPPSLEDAQESYQYWLTRQQELPRHKRHERAEAEQMAARWKQRLDAARRERYGPTPFEQLLETLGIRWRPNVHRLIRNLSILAILAVILIIAVIVAIIAFWSDLQPVIHTLTGGGQGEGGG